MLFTVGWHPRFKMKIYILCFNGFLKNLLKVIGFFIPSRPTPERIGSQAVPARSPGLGCRSCSGALDGTSHRRCHWAASPTLFRVSFTIGVVWSTAAYYFGEILQWPAHVIWDHAMETTPVELMACKLTNITSYNKGLRDPRVFHGRTDGTNGLIPNWPTVRLWSCW